MVNEKAGWKVHFNKLLKHIVHDMQKGLVNQTYLWDNVQVVTTHSNEVVRITRNGTTAAYTWGELGTQEQDYKDNSVTKYLIDATVTSTIAQETTKGTNAETFNTTSQETNTMNKSSFSPSNIANEAASTFKTVGAEIAAQAITSAKMEAGENILLGMRNLVLKQAGFFGKIKFKLLPVALDAAVTILADVVSVEFLPNSTKAKLARECLNLAMTKEVISTLPLKEFTETMTGGQPLKMVSDLIHAKSE